jgi:hypothetical protein
MAGLAEALHRTPLGWGLRLDSEMPRSYREQEAGADCAERHGRVATTARKNLIGPLAFVAFYEKKAAGRRFHLL